MPSDLGRINPLHAEIEDLEVKRVLDGLQETFGPEWLGKEAKHRVRDVWRRTDATSTIELFTLGLAIEAAREIDSKWLSHQLARVQANDDNTCKGALFEILALAMFAGGDLEVVPAPPNNPGVDFYLTADEGNRVAVSTKTFGLTSHNLEFLRKFEKMRRYLLAQLDSWPFTSVMIAVSGTKYPACQTEWDILQDALVRGVSSKSEIAGSCGSWEFAITHPDGPVNRRTSDPLSHQFFAYCRSHPNEQKNYYDKFCDALNNIARHTNPLETGIKNMLFFRVPGSLFVTRLLEPLIQALNDLPDSSQIAVAGLYQPSVVWRDDSSLSLHHFAHPVVRYTDKDWFDSTLGTNRAVMKVLVGTTSSHPSRNLIRDDTGNAVFMPDDAYYYQCGERFVISKLDGIRQRFQLQQLAPGIRLNSLIEFPDGGLLDLRGNFSSELCILQEEAVNLRDVSDELL